MGEREGDILSKVSSRVGERDGDEVFFGRSCVYFLEGTLRLKKIRCANECLMAKRSNHMATKH